MEAIQQLNDGPPPVIEYRVTRDNGIPYSWAAVDEEHLKREWDANGWKFTHVEIYSEWEAEQRRIDNEQIYQTEMNKSAEELKAS